MFIQGTVCLAICILYIITPYILEDNYERIKIENFFYYNLIAMYTLLYSYTVMMGTMGCMKHCWIITRLDVKDIFLMLN